MSAIAFAAADGLSGFAWATIIVGGAVILPAPLAFVVGQFGVVATTPTASTLLIAEVGLGTLLVIDVIDTARHPLPVLFGALTAALIGVIPWQLEQAAQGEVLLYLAITLASILYGIHRYELYTTGQLEP
ncbi:hypothetical protein PNQ29_09780 [Halobacterium salinarum]|uniref:hypothetical protein n=1 Tax=Halobacterium salinarum TaxID=2242 RepID=UPI0025568971|nr:hypothetical protein [Halobacterium salinarum]MDL0120017.1 hypothetical protein [Halobacterium salinarum]MDL0128293.1 hypothetical protein [Halobacterium salinarum]